jgi:hypothetical protein
LYDYAGPGSATMLAMNGEYVYAADGAAPTRLVEISKTSCETRTLYRTNTDAFIDGLAIAGGFTYFESYGKLYATPATGDRTPAEVSLTHLFGTVPLYLGPLGSYGDTVYILVGHDAVDGGTPYSSLVEIPCCNATPRIRGERPFEEWGGSRLVRDGNRLFMFGEEFLLDAPILLTLSTFDLVTGQGRAVFRGAAEVAMTTPLGVHHGRPYFAQDGQLTTVDVDTCAATAGVRNRIFDRVSAFAADDRAIYWAETYRDLPVSRIFMKTDDSSLVVQVIEASGAVTWLGVDSSHVYWAEAQGNSPQHSHVFRIARPR